MDTTNIYRPLIFCCHLFSGDEKDTLTPSLSKAVNYLNNWDHKADMNSIATTIAIEWATKWNLEIPAATTEEEGTQIIKKYERMVKEVSTQKRRNY